MAKMALHATSVPKALKKPPATGYNLLFKSIILALCIISCIHVFISPLVKVPQTVQTFLDLEQSLCMYNIKHRQGRDKATQCPQNGVITTMQGGRLGNQMWEYASVWAAARQTGLEAYVPRCIRLEMEKIFESSSLTVPSFEEIAHCSMQRNSFIKSIDSWNSTSQIIILRKYALEADLVLPWVQDVRQEFTIRRTLRRKSQQVLRTAIRRCSATNRSNPHVFVGVHVRRTDYLKYLERKYNSTPADADFFRRAMQYFDEKYDSPIFVFVSDDANWCTRQFSSRKNVYVASNALTTPFLDLAILAACNHTIYDYGTFGGWGAILAGGETIFYNVTTRHISAKLAKYLNNWHTI